MSVWRRVIGVDAFEVGLQAVITAILVVWAAETNNQQDAIVICSMVSVGSLLVLGIRRRLALRRAGREGVTELDSARVAELDSVCG